MDYDDEGATIPGGDMTPSAPAGTHPAVLCGVWDLGVREHPRWGPRHELCLWWEIAARSPMGQQYGIRDIVTASLGAKANLRRRMEALTGAPPSNGDMALGAIRKAIVGRRALIELVAPESNPKGHPFVRSVLALPRGVAGPKIEGDYSVPPGFVRFVRGEADETPPPADEPPPDASHDCTEHVDPKSGRTYYRFADGRTSWTPF